MGALGDFLNAGPERTAARNQWLEENVVYYIPPNLRPWLTVGDALNPVSDIRRAGGSARTIANPQSTPQQRIGAAGNMAVDMASVLAPVAGAKYGGDSTKAIVDALAMASMPADDAAQRFVADKTGAIRFSNEMRGHHHGQSDMTLRATDSGKSVGRVDYSVYDGDPHIQMIEVDPLFRRQGYGSALLGELQAKYPDREIEWGSLTREGSALYDATRFKDVPTAHASKFSELENLKARSQELERAVSEAWGTDAQQPAMEAFYANEDRVRELARELEGLSPSKRIIQGARKPQG